MQREIGEGVCPKPERGIGILLQRRGKLIEGHAGVQFDQLRVMRFAVAPLAGLLSLTRIWPGPWIIGTHLWNHTER